MTASAPGWYPDPTTPDLMRWWDGQLWTATTGAASAPPKTRRVPIVAKIAIGLVGLMAVGAGVAAALLTGATSGSNAGTTAAPNVNPPHTLPGGVPAPNKASNFDAMDRRFLVESGAQMLSPSVQEGYVIEAKAACEKRANGRTNPQVTTSLSDSLGIDPASADIVRVAAIMAYCSNYLY